MMNNLWSDNTPSRFWHCQPEPPEESWDEAIRRAFPVLGFPHQVDDLETALSFTLGEGQFGQDRFQLGLNKRLYYQLKPLLPRGLINLLKRLNARNTRDAFPLQWPIEDRYVRFQREIIRQLLILTGETHMKFRRFWPGGKQFALVLTHDVESVQGVDNVRQVADLEEALGFRSSFNFVPDLYPLDYRLIDELKERGFEIGVHGLKHDGKLFASRKRFMQRAEKINSCIGDLGAVGFRAPLMHRHPEWLQDLEIEYDLSFFDTDPYEPMPGGCMSIWPFSIGRFVELPYTLMQDSTLRYVLKESTARVWHEKLEFIKNYCGMALVNTHPDYLQDPILREIYFDFLNTLKSQNHYWHALPKEVSQWWRKRSDLLQEKEPQDLNLGTVVLEDGHIEII